MLVDFDRDRPDNSPALGRFRKKDDKDQKINSLIDMSAKLVGKSYSCEQLENHHPTLDESLLKKVNCFLRSKMFYQYTAVHLYCGPFFF